MPPTRSWPAPRPAWASRTSSKPSSPAFRRRRAIRQAPLKALIIDSWFDNYVGVVMLVRVVDGVLRPKDKILLMSTGSHHLCEQVGVFTPKSMQRAKLSAGEVGFVIAGIKELHAAKVGDTVTLAERRAPEPLPGFKEIKPQVFAGLYPVEANQYDSLRDSLEKLKLNDASLQYEPEVSQALGFGFRCGFLGLLHMEIVQERLEREYDMDLITTAPTVVYEVLMRDGTVVRSRTPPSCRKPPEDRGDPRADHHHQRSSCRRTTSAVITLCEQKRGTPGEHAVPRPPGQLTYDMPMAEVVMDFFDKLKSVSRGYASLDYEFKEYRAGRRGQARRPDQRRQGRCAVGHRASRQRPVPRPRTGRRCAS
jgi:GTP-binding protein LepA